MIRKLLLIIFVSFFSIGLFAQSGALKGTVIDKSTKEPIPFANVVVELNGNMVGGGTSDFDGNYTIKPIPAGKFVVKASYVGYSTLQMNGVVIYSDKIRFLNLLLEGSSEQLEEVVVVDYKVPLISKDNTQTGGTVTSEDIAKMSGRSAESVASTVGGVFQEDGEIKSVRGARQEATTYYIDGVKVRGSRSLPKSAIEQVAVVTGGLDAKYGDATGGIISITTKGPSRTMFGGIEITTSKFLDKFNENLLGLNLSGPLISKKTVDPNDATKVTKTPIAGFFLSGELTYVEDDYPSAIGMWKVKDNVLDSIVKNPIVPSATGNITTLTADYLQKNSFEKISTRKNVGRYGANISGKFDIKPSKNTNFTVGGNLSYVNRHSYSFTTRGGYANSLFNWDNYPELTETTWRTFARFTQKFSNSSSDEKSASVIKNAYYSIQADYSKYNRKIEDDSHGDSFFDYGYVGKFQTHKINSYAYGVDSISGLSGLLQNGFVDTLFSFNRSDVNPEISNYTDRYYGLYNETAGHYENSVMVQNGGGVLNGEKPNSIYGLYSSPGEQYDKYSKIDNSQFRVSAAGSADIKDHAISLGFEFEQRNDRYFSIGDNSNLGPVELWNLARNLMNFHILELDYSNPQVGYVKDQAGNFVLDANGKQIFNDTISYNRIYNANSQKLFDINFRKAHAYEIAGTEWVDIDSYSPEDLSIDYFSADELLNSGNNYVTYYGYDHHGNRLNSNPSFEEFFTETYTDSQGNVRYKRELAPFQPTYVAGYIQDKFAFNDLIFNVGLRIDRYDANQKVLKDKFLMFESYKVGDNDPRGIIQATDIPKSIGEGTAVYVDNIDDPKEIVGYRSGSNWYDATGNQLSDPNAIYTSTGISPYLIDPNDKVGGTSFLNSYSDYEPQISVMPRISFSFPISDEALFFAHYDVLTKRPVGYGRLDPIDYLFIYKNAGGYLHNPDLKPEKTIDYELGFQQKISSTSSLKLSSFYREMRDMAQVINVAGAYPVDYKTWGNIDFGTVKGFTATYDMRRTNNVSFRASYTLQFANGTGSNSTTASGLIAAGLPNLRATMPYDFDIRNAIVGTIDYRFPSGKDYHGPRLFGKDIFANAGTNIAVNTSSGTPYSKRDVNSNSLVGTVNGSHKPWRTTINMRIDKDFDLTFGKSEDENKHHASINVYVDVSNLFDTENIINVYETTGNPDDNGYLTAAKNQPEIFSQNDPEAYINYYRMIINNPASYSLPRRIRFGVMLNF
ncbi:MAG: carboxypeptidase-like regulatory domain-containing protein [Bacteroidetes bacterium]|nr:carboxypeptidase-like regulatory domain-containing protein [Bacteroidota bacterium]